MDTKRVIYFCISSLIVGIFIGIITGHYLFPKVSGIENELQQQSVYTIEHKCEEKKIVEPAIYCVDINGAVKTPGVYCLKEGSLVNDVLKKAGGLKTTYAKEYIDRKVNLAFPIRNNQKIYLPYTKDVDCILQDFNIVAKDIEDNLTPPEDTNTDNEESESDTQCVNINTATIEQLDGLDGVGPSTAQKIIDGRPYTKKEDILNVSGIGESTYEKFKDAICI